MAIIDIRTELQQAWASSEPRRERDKRRFAILRGAWANEVKEAIRRRFSPENAAKILETPQTGVNLLLLAAREIAGAIYSQPVRRLDAATGEELQAFAVEWDFVLSEAATQAFAVGRAALMPRVSEDGLLSVQLFPAGEWTAQPLEDWSGLRWFMWRDEQGFLFWDDANVTRLSDDFTPVESSPHGFDRVPIVIATGAPQTRSFWETEADAESEILLHAAVDFAVALSDIANIRKHQSFKQLVIKGQGAAEVATTLVQDPTIAIGLTDPTDSVSVIDLQTDIVKQVEAAIAQLEITLAQLGLTPEILRGKVDAQSGYALRLKQFKLAQRQATQRRLWGVYEQRLFALGRQLVPLPADIRIDWPDIGPAADPVAEVQTLSQLVSAGIISKREALRKLGYSDDEAGKILMELAQEQLLTVTPPPPPPADLIAPADAGMGSAGGQ